MSILTHLCGGVTDTTAVIKARVEAGATEVRVRLAQHPVTFGPEVPDTNGMVTFHLTGLLPNTRYTGVYEIDGVPDASRVFRFRTFPEAGKPASFMFTAFNCMGSTSQSGYSSAGYSNTPALRHVLDKDPLFHMLVGDWGYYDISTNNQDLYRAAWLTNLSKPNQKAFFDNVSLVYMYDDHDGPSNNGNRTYASVPAMLANYREQMPCYPLEPSGPVYHSFTCGRVLFIISDGRAARDPNADPLSESKTMLGEDQRQWLIDLLETTKAPAVVWVISSVWIDGSANGGDGWGSFTHERDIIASAIQTYRARGGLFVGINGDYHVMAMDDGSNNTWGGFPVFHFGAMDCAQNGAPPWSKGYLGGFGNYGTIEVEDDGENISIVGTGWQNSRRWQTIRLAVPDGYVPPGTYRVRGRDLERA